jgi:hypothetical protein
MSWSKTGRSSSVFVSSVFKTRLFRLMVLIQPTSMACWLCTRPATSMIEGDQPITTMPYRWTSSGQGSQAFMTAALLSRLQVRGLWSRSQPLLSLIPTARFMRPTRRLSTSRLRLKELRCSPSPEGLACCSPSGPSSWYEEAGAGRGLKLKHSVRCQHPASAIATHKTCEVRTDRHSPQSPRAGRADPGRSQIRAIPRQNC